MRVLETDPSTLYKMGKNKKHRIRKSKENDVDESSDEGQQSGCPHITKAVNINTVRKTITKTSVSIEDCTDCVKDGSKSVTRDLFGGVVEGTAAAAAAAADGDDADIVMETSICVCLQCGHQGCDRNSANKHALKHYKTPHTGLHCIIVNLTHWSTWCYICDDVVPVNARIQACIDFLQKTCGVNTNKPEMPLSPTVKTTDSVMTEGTSFSGNMSCKPSTSCAKVKGLSNLGNTCFFNAVMQSMCQTRSLENLLVERAKQDKLIIQGPMPGCDSDSSSNSGDEEKEDDNIDKHKPLPTIQTVGGDPGPVTQALLGLMQEMKGGSAKNGTVNPTALFTQVCKKAPRFKGFQQQDSHELLRYLIDCIRIEEVRKGQGSILKYFKLSEMINPKRVDEDTKMKIKQYGRQVKHTFLDSVFGGQLVSTVKCEECKNVSQIYETFLDLSLPVMEEKPQRPSITLIGKKKDMVSLADDADISVATNMGLDPCHDRPSKYQDKKNKRNAKKEAKRKSKSQKSRTFHPSQFMNQDDTKEKRGSGDEDIENASDASSGGKIVEEGSKKSGDVLKDGQEQSCPNDATLAVNGGGSGEEIRLTERDKGEDADEGSCLKSSPEGSKDGLDTNRDDGSSSKDDPSDADIEDNLEGDQSRFVPTDHQDLPEQNDVSNEVTLIVPDNCTKAGDEKSENMHHLIKKVEGLCLQKNEGDGGNESHQIDSKRSDEGMLDNKAAGCEMFSVDTCVNNFSDLQLNNGDGKDIANTKDEKSDLCNNKQKSSQTVVVSNGGLETDPTNLTSKPEVSATFNISLPSHEASQMPSATTEEEGVGVKSVNDSTELTSPCVKRTDSVKGKAENSEGDEVQQEAKKNGDEKQLSTSGFKRHLEYLKEAKQHSMNTLAPRYQAAPKECSILSCLNQFTAAELLTGSNKVGCKLCTKNKRDSSVLQKASVGEKKGKETVYSNANKQYLIFRPPAVLTLHLKRFEQTGLMSRKVNRHVDFPLVLDLAPYCSSLCTGVKEGQSKVLYSLYGIVEHSGRLNGGHYTAYVKLRPGLSSHTQFLNTTPPGTLDMLNAYLERIVKLKCVKDLQSSPRCTTSGTDSVDKDMEGMAETFVAPGRWFHISDSRVNEVSEASVLKAQAYLLFYERIF